MAPVGGLTPAPPVRERGGGDWFADERGVERRLRVSWHGERRLFVLSIWQEDRCTATFRLPLGEVPRLVKVLVDAAVGSVVREPSGGVGAHRRRWKG